MHSIVRRYIQALLLLAAPSTAFGQPLSAFLQSAQTRNVDGRIAHEAAGSARASFDQQWGVLLPSLSANGGYTRNQYAATVDIPNGATTTQTITIIPQDQLEATFKAEVPLIDVSKWLKVSAASESSSAAESKELLTQDQVRRQVVTAYFSWAGAQGVLDSAQKSLAVAKAQVEQQTARKEAGVATELELVRASAEVERNTQVVADAEALLANSRRSLRTLSGLEPGEDTALPVDDLHPESPLAELEGRADGLPSITSAEHDATAASRSWTAAAATLAPTVNAQFTQRFTNATGFQNQGAVWNAGVTFSWRADLGSVQGLRIASASEQTARLNAEKTRLAAVDQIHSDWQRVRAAITKVKASRAQVESTRRAQSLAKERNAAGVATQLDVIQADRDLFSAEMNDISARLDLATARASLRLSAGLPLEVTP
jgi:outer membrane protein TolC